MKIYFQYLIASYTLIFSCTADAQLMRMALLPQPTVKITPSHQPVLAALGLDYHLMEPNGASSGQPDYNQVLGPADVVVKINNKLTHKTFQSLVEGENSLILLHPLSKDRVQVELNNKHPESQGIENLELDVLAPVAIGYNKSDADMKLSSLIFKNFGWQMPPSEYLNRAMVLDIMQQNQKLLYNENFELTVTSSRVFNRLYQSLDFSMFSPRDFKTYVTGNFISITDSGDFTQATTTNLQMAIWYQQSIAATQPINNNWKSKAFNDCKSIFYTDSYRLQIPADSVVNGEAYVHMMAWKAKGFATPTETKPYIIKRGDSVFYRSAPAFFAGAFFMVQARELEQWLRTNRPAPGATRYRLMQLLGLPPNSGNDQFLDLWVKRADLFRPAIDSSLNLTGMLTTLDSGYMKAFLNYSSGSFSAPTLMSKYPFTGLGYTWDWNPENKNHVGLNEFVLREGRELYIGRNYTTSAFMQLLGL